MAGGGFSFLASLNSISLWQKSKVWSQELGSKFLFHCAGEGGVLELIRPAGNAILNSSWKTTLPKTVYTRSTHWTHHSPSGDRWDSYLPLPREASGTLMLILPSGGWICKMHLEGYIVSRHFSSFLIWFHVILIYNYSAPKLLSSTRRPHVQFPNQIDWNPDFYLIKHRMRV